MSAKADSQTPAGTTKKFGKGERHVPHHSAKAQRYYAAEPDSEPKKTRKTVRPAKPRESLQPGTVLILLAGRFRGKRVILLKHLPQGVLLVTGPFKINGVPLRRVNARYVIATSQTVDLKGVDQQAVEKASKDGYFTAEKKKEKAGEEAFFKHGEKAEKKPVASARAADQKAVDKALLSNIKSDSHLVAYLRSSFSLRKGDRPHLMKW